jgi:hypothetical protein
MVDLGPDIAFVLLILDLSGNNDVRQRRPP